MVAQIREQYRRAPDVPAGHLAAVAIEGDERWSATPGTHLLELVAEAENGSCAGGTNLDPDLQITGESLPGILASGGDAGRSSLVTREPDFKGSSASNEPG
jgi:hypothetical protein